MKTVIAVILSLATLGTSGLAPHQPFGRQTTPRPVATPTPDDYVGMARYYRCGEYFHGRHVRGWLVQTKFTEPNGGGGGPELWEHRRATGDRPWSWVADCQR